METRTSPETQEEYSSRVELFIFRHGDKEKDPNKTDFQIELTGIGGERAANQAELDDIRYAIAHGSPRIRTQQTAALKMAGRQEGVTGHEGAEALLAKLDTMMHGDTPEAARVGKKVGVDSRLNFVLDKGTPYGDAAYAAYETPGRFLPFWVRESDQVAREFGDSESTTYSRAAAGIAELVKKNIAIARQWDKIKTGEVPAQKEYEGDTLSRFAGTHQCVGESFLLKLVEKTKGAGERDRLMELMNNLGFDTTEGFKIDIVNTGAGAEPRVRVQYIKERHDGPDPAVLKPAFEFDEEISPELLDEIIAEGAGANAKE